MIFCLLNIQIQMPLQNKCKYNIYNDNNNNDDDDDDDNYKINLVFHFLW